MMRSQTAISARPKRDRIQKQACHPQWTVTQPMIGAKSTSAKYCDELKIAEAVPRSAVGNHAVTMRPFPGNTGDWTRPESSRKAMMETNAKVSGRYPESPTPSAQMAQPRIAYA